MAHFHENAENIKPSSNQIILLQPLTYIHITLMLPKKKFRAVPQLLRSSALFLISLEMFALGN